MQTLPRRKRLRSVIIAQLGDYDDDGIEENIEKQGEKAETFAHRPFPRSLVS